LEGKNYQSGAYKKDKPTSPRRGIKILRLCLALDDIVLRFSAIAILNLFRMRRDWQKKFPIKSGRCSLICFALSENKVKGFGGRVFWLTLSLLLSSLFFIVDSRRGEKVLFLINWTFVFGRAILIKAIKNLGTK